MGYRRNLGDGSDVRPTLTIITPNDGPWANFSLQDWNQASGQHRDGSHTICPFYIAWFISCLLQFLLFFFLAMEALSLLEWNLSAHALMVAGSLEIPTKEQMTHICQPFRKILVQNKRQPQATSVLIFIGHHCCEFLRFLACFTLIYNEVLTCSLRGTQPVALIQKETCWLQ